MWRWCKSWCSKPPEDENVQRGNWSNPCEFILASLGFAIGLGNVWRYPYLVYKHGGGTFVVAYWIMLFTVAMPVFLLEISLGQFASQGPVKLFRTILPAGEGVGLTIMLTQAVQSIYYNALFGWAVLYMFSSMSNPMPWAICSLGHNDDHCVALNDWENCGGDSSDSLFYYRNKCFNSSKPREEDFHIQKDFFDTFKNCTSESFKLDGKPVPNNCAIDLKIVNTSWISTRYSTYQNTLTDLRLSDKMANDEGVVFFLDSKISDVDQTLFYQLSHTGFFDEEKQITFGTKAGHAIFEYFNFPAGSNPPSIHSFLYTYCKDNDLFENDTLGLRCARATIDNFDYRSQYSSEQFFFEYFNAKDASYLNPGGIKWQAALAFALSWVLIGIGVTGGVKWTGKLVYVTAPLPIIILLVLAIYGAFLEGKEEGYQFYLRMEWDAMKDWDLWRDALSQIFFSLSVGGGGLTTLASYNRFHNDIFTDSAIIVVGNCLTSFIGGFGLFAVMGYMSKKVHMAVGDLMKQGGTGIAFMTFAHATTVMPGGQFWGVIFFLTLGLLAIDSQFAIVETVLTYIYDEFDVPRKKRWIVVLIYSVICFLLGLPHISRNGSNYLNLVDNSLYVFLILIQVIAELYIVIYFYGMENFVDDMFMILGKGKCREGGKCIVGRVMFNRYTKWYWCLTWYIFCPIGVGVMTLQGYTTVCLNGFGELIPGDDPNHPIGIAVIVLLGILPFPAFLIGCCLYSFLRRGYTLSEMTKPRQEWGPALNQHRSGRYHPIESALDRTQSDKSRTPASVFHTFHQAPHQRKSIHRQSLASQQSQLKDVSVTHIAPQTVSNTSANRGATSRRESDVTSPVTNEDIVEHSLYTKEELPEHSTESINDTDTDTDETQSL